MDDKKVIIVAAGGQDYPVVPWPASFDRIIAVGGYKFSDSGIRIISQKERWLGGYQLLLVEKPISLVLILMYATEIQKGRRMVTFFISTIMQKLGGFAALWLGHHGRDNLIDFFDVQNGIKLQEAFREVLPLTANADNWYGANYETKESMVMVQYD